MIYREGKMDRLMGAMNLFVWGWYGTSVLFIDIERKCEPFTTSDGAFFMLIAMLGIGVSARLMMRAMDD